MYQCGDKCVDINKINKTNMRCGKLHRQHKGRKIQMCNMSSAMTYINVIVSLCSLLANKEHRPANVTNLIPLEITDALRQNQIPSIKPSCSRLGTYDSPRRFKCSEYSSELLVGLLAVMLDFQAGFPRYAIALPKGYGKPVLNSPRSLCYSLT